MPGAIGRRRQLIREAEVYLSDRMDASVYLSELDFS